MLKILPYTGMEFDLNRKDPISDSECFAFEILLSDQPNGKSQHSQHSRAVHTPFGLDDIEIDGFEERAAIMEFDGGLSKEAAELRALVSVLAARSN